MPRIHAGFGLKLLSLFTEMKRGKRLEFTALARSELGLYLTVKDVHETLAKT